jgi:AraC family transcriptional regulator, transcriptional activator of pobA
MKDIPVRKINSSKKEEEFSGNFSIRDVRQLLNGKDITQELHRHDFFYILALKTGLGKHEIDFTSYKVCNFSVFFMRPGQVHQHTLKAGSSGYLIEFKNDFYYPYDKLANRRIRLASKKNHCILDAAGFKKTDSILTTIFQEYTEKQEGYLEIIKANLGIFFIELIRQQSKNRNTSIPLNTYPQERLEELLELIEINIYKNKQVSDYADMLNLTPYQLNAITKTTLGKTCSEVINDFIILESKRYLLATSNQINQIAYHLGYEDVSYFIRFFKKHTGSSPEVFRNNFR